MSKLQKLIISFFIFFIFISCSYAQEYSRLKLTFIITGNTTPSINLISPSDGLTILNPLITFSANYSDSSAVSNCTFYVQSYPDYLIINPTNPMSYTLSLTAYGSYSWYVTCTNIFGFTGTSSIYTVNYPSGSGPGGPNTGGDYDTSKSQSNQTAQTNSSTKLELYAEPSKIDYIKNFMQSGDLKELKPLGFWTLSILGILVYGLILLIVRFSIKVVTGK